MALGAVKRSVGLEIDSGAVRAVEVTGSALNPRLVGMAEARLPAGAVEEGMIVQPQEVGAALRNLWSSSEIKYRNVLLGVTNQGVLVRYAAIPKVPADKLANVIRFHAQEHLPIPLESVVLDFQIIGETSTDGNTVLEVLLVAARRDMLDGFLEALALAKLEPADIDVSNLALIRTLPQQALARSVVVVNIANGLSNILISVQGQPRLARLFSVKIKDLADSLGCALEDVLKVAANLSGNLHSTYSQWVNNLVTETRSSLTYYQNQENASPLEAIIINGRGARLSGIASRLQEAIGLPVRVVNPFAGFADSGHKIEGSGIKTVDYAICAGLARRGLEGS